MSTVRLSFSPAAAHVRTARLVGVAVARRAGVAEELLEEIRLAIGEACSRAVALHRTHGVDDLVDVAMDDGERFTVRVIDRAGNGSALAGPAPSEGLYLTTTSAVPSGALNGGLPDAAAAGAGSASRADGVDGALWVSPERASGVSPERAGGVLPERAGTASGTDRAAMASAGSDRAVAAAAGPAPAGAGGAARDDAAPDGTRPDALGEEAVVARMGLALLAGLVDDLAVASVGDGLGTEVSMSWPVERRISGN